MKSFAIGDTVDYCPGRFIYACAWIIESIQGAGKDRIFTIRNGDDVKTVPRRHISRIEKEESPD
jgi:hypothetical protein